MTSAIHIHEDDWGMRNLYPVAALSAANADVARAVAAGQANRAEDGVGWTDMHLIAAPSVTFAEVGLDLAQTAAALEAIVPRVRTFAATAMAGFSAKERDPYGTYDDDAYCFGFGADCFVKLEPSGALVRGVWFEARTQDAMRRKALLAALAAIDARAESIIADYWIECVGRVRDAGFMARYEAALTN